MLVKTSLACFLHCLTFGGLIRKTPKSVQKVEVRTSKQHAPKVRENHAKNQQGLDVSDLLVRPDPQHAPKISMR